MLISNFSTIFFKTTGNLIKFLNPKFYILNPRSGFTLVEIVVTMAILIIFSGILVGYNQTSSRQLVLISNQAKLVSLVSRAKNLSMSTILENPGGSYNPGDPVTCAYGVHVDKSAGKIFIFRDLAVDCSLSDNKYSSDTERNGLKGEFDVFELDSKIAEFMPATSDDLNDIIFIPPDPKVVINNDVSKLWAQIGLKLKNSDAGKIIIKINNVGQISTR